MKVLRSVSLVLAICLFATLALAGSRKERQEARLAESAKPKSVPGGVTIENAATYDKTYDTVLNHLKRQGYTLDAADRDIGQLITAMTITGGYSQTGTRIQVALIKDSETKTTLRVAVTEQTRKKLLQTEPWSDPKVNQEESARIAGALKSALAQND